MKTRKLFAFLLALAMILSLAACSSSSGSDTGSTDTSDTSAETEAATDTESTDESEDTQVWEGEITEINAYFMCITGVSEGADEVVDAMNAITEETIGVHLNATYIAAGDYETTISLALSSGEPMDIFVITGLSITNFVTLTSNGQLMDITEYMEDEGAETLEMMADYIGAYTVSGSIYGVPAYRNYASSAYVVMRKDVLENLDLLEFAENATTWSETRQNLSHPQCRSPPGRTSRDGHGKSLP